MVTINFFKDGAYIKGHDIQEICTLVSYAMWACINDCHTENQNIKFYESCNDDNWKHLGLTFLKIDVECDEHIKLLSRLENNLLYWLEVMYPNRIGFSHSNGNIDWDSALQDAKQEQGIK